MSLKINKIKGTIEVITGLHIGAGRDTIEIGGMDNPIIKEPGTGYPYIPGSSLKGKLRALLEWYDGKVLENKGNPCNCGSCDVCDIFGLSNKENKKLPTRIVVRDCFIDKSTIEKLEKGEIELFEEKYENSLNRITAEANPRPIERVAPGIRFDFEIRYKIFTGEDKTKSKKVLEKILISMALLEEDYLGGGGSRGSGCIRFNKLTLVDRFEDKEKEIQKEFIKLKSKL
jgi:CRISPR-associated protein Csm3